MLTGAVRDRGTGKRRPFVRFFACERDLSLEAPDKPLPEAVASGAQPFLIVAAALRAVSAKLGELEFRWNLRRTRSEPMQENLERCRHDDRPLSAHPIS